LGRGRNTAGRGERKRKMEKDEKWVRGGGKWNGEDRARTGEEGGKEKKGKSGRKN